MTTAFLALAAALVYAVVVIQRLSAPDRPHRVADLLIVIGAVWLPIAAMWHLAALDAAAHGAADVSGTEAAAFVSLAVGITAQVAGLRIGRSSIPRVRAETSPRYKALRG